MSRIEPVEISTMTEHIMAEIKTLSDQQQTAVQNASIVGMTEGQQDEYSERAVRILKLVKRLAAMHAPSL